MWASSTKSNHALGKKNGGNGLFAVGIDKDKSSQYALRWAVDNLLVKGQTLVLIHVVHKSSSTPATNLDDETHKQQLEAKTKDLFLSFHCYCSRKDVRCLDIALEDTNIGKALAEYVAHAAINTLVLGSSRHGFIKRLKSIDVPTAVLKAAPDFCTVYVISKSKISSVRNATRVAPFTSPLREQINALSSHNSFASDNSDSRYSIRSTYTIKDKPGFRGTITPSPGKNYSSSQDGFESNRSSITKAFGKQHGDFSEVESDISFIGSNRPSSDGFELGRTSKVSVSSDGSLESELMGSKGSEFSYMNDHFSSISFESQDDVEAEMKRLKIELMKAMNLYNVACKEATISVKKTSELQRWRMEEERRIRERSSSSYESSNGGDEETNENPKAKSETDAYRRIENLEKQKRLNAEKKERGQFDVCNFRYRKYTIEEIEEATEIFDQAHKIGEGGYGPVFKCSLDHTTVAVKVLRPDANQGKSQFHQEVEVLSCIRHPNLVLLLGACPEYGCLVYEYLSNGSLEDRLFRRGNTPALSWQLRFRIITEVATGLLFLHRTKPEPIVHRDLKPANILLDSNFVSKISDVGLARLVPSSVNEDVTQYRMTSAAGTFCYIDPEYQQSGMLGVKSDIYSLGIIMLQVLTAGNAMGVSHAVSEAIEENRFSEVLDPHVPDWPIEEALNLAKLSLQCAELRRKDRPDLGKVILPELSRLRDFAVQNMANPYLVH